MNIVTEVLTALQEYDRVVKRKHGKSPELGLKLLILTLIDKGNTKDTALALGVSNRTLERLLPTVFSGLTHSNTEWRNRLLSTINKRYCPKCTSIKDIKEYSASDKTYYAAQVYCKSCDCLRAETYRLNNKEKCSRLAKEHYTLNKSDYLARNAKRRATKLNATPSWSETDLIKEFYANCPEGYHVDHEVPLQGELVCGLHVIANLQYLTARDNLSKGNKFNGT